MMRKFVLWFILFVLMYHVVVTFFSFGLWRVPPYSILLLRDISRLVVVALFAVLHAKHLKTYNAQFGNILICFLFLLVAAILTSVFMESNVKQIFVGIKYSLYYIVPFLTAIYLGVVWSHTLPEKSIKKRIYYVRVILVCAFIFWWLWQIAKNFLPSLMQWFGYWPIGDYVFGQNPPLYYLTWPKGIQRWSGIFSWPNNYWYLLVAFFWLYWYGVRAYVSSMSGKIFLWILYIATLLATLSRGAILGVLAQVILLSYIVNSAQRKTILIAIVAGVWAVLGLSLLKRQSTLAHIKAKVNSLSYVQQSPLWYGLWSSGPSIHSQWWYLPENFFIQLMMDLWVHGFILWWAFWIMVFIILRRLYQQKPTSRLMLFCVSIGFVWLMIEWMFLHVLEDSMVNYMYFITWWVVVGYVAGEHRLFRSVEEE